MSQEKPKSAGRKNPASGPIVEPPRRGFLAGALAILVGGLISLFPVATGLFVFLDPLRKRDASRTKGDEEDETVDSEGYIRIASVDSLPSDGTPQFVTVIADRTDAWTYFHKQPIGAVTLCKTDDDVTAFNVECPHAGCVVAYNTDDKQYVCPCHDSTFTLEGQRSENSPSPRDLDSLQIKQKDGFVWVKYEKFQKGPAERISES